MTVSQSTLLGGLSLMAQQGSIPLREPVYNRAGFWAQSLTLTKTRPIPALTPWTDYLVIQMGTGFAPQGYGARIEYFIGTSLTDMLTSGIEYQFLHNGTVMNVNEFGLQPGVEMHVDRLLANPWPAQPRRFNYTLMNNDRFVMQVRNTAGVGAVALAALFGFYFPNTRGQDKGELEASGSPKAESYRDT